MTSTYPEVTDAPPRKTAPARPVLWANEEITRRTARGGAHSRVLRDYYRANHFNGDQDEEMRPDDYRDALFLESDRARTARHRLTDWLVHEKKVLQHAKWITEQNPSAPAEALSIWFDQLFYGTGVLVLPRDIRCTVQGVADSMARSSLCKADWNKIAREVTEAETDAKALA